MGPLTESNFFHWFWSVCDAVIAIPLFGCWPAAHQLNSAGFSGATAQSPVPGSLLVLPHACETAGCADPSASLTLSNDGPGYAVTPDGFHADVTVRTQNHCGVQVYAHTTNACNDTEVKRAPANVGAKDANCRKLYALTDVPPSGVPTFSSCSNEWSPVAPDWA